MYNIFFFLSFLNERNLKIPPVKIFKIRFSIRTLYEIQLEIVFSKKSSRGEIITIIKNTDPAVYPANISAKNTAMKYPS